MVEWFGTRILEKVRQGVQRGLVTGGEMVRSEAIRLILDSPHTGRVYRRRSIEHQASAAGEPPASDTGRLVNSILVDYDLNNLKATVLASTAYAALLEYGTQRMSPRPFMRPALANKSWAARQAMFTEVRRALGN